MRGQGSCPLLHLLQDTRELRLPISFILALKLSQIWYSNQREISLGGYRDISAEIKERGRLLITGQLHECGRVPCLLHQIACMQPPKAMALPTFSEISPIRMS